ncbi:MAG: hypothetical protein HY430_02605 [Candidatus Levybacteria bacterium]|nr:hypothetical protein [Candidatus Levybacteria bacterium]
MRIPAKNILTQKGQALVTLLFFLSIAITVTTGAVIIAIVNSVSTSKTELGVYAHAIAESGIENALLRLLRDPSYAGESLPVDGGTAVITVTGTDPIIVVSEGKIENFTRKIQADVTYTTGTLSAVSWKEVH